MCAGAHGVIPVLTRKTRTGQAGQQGVVRVAKGVVVLAHDQGTALVAGSAYRAQMVSDGPVASRGRSSAFLPGKDIYNLHVGT